MAGIRRPPRLVTAAFILVLLGGLYYHLGSKWTLDEAQYYTGYRSVKDSTPRKFSSQYNGAVSQFNGAAHRLPDADDFFPHFKAVLSEPGVTMAEARSGCNWEDEGAVNFQYVASEEWAVKPRDDKEIAYRRKQWRDHIAQNLIPWGPNRHRFQGRGIVVVAGNERSLIRVRIMLRRLKQLGSKLPIELHYWAEEMNDEKKAEIASMWHTMYFNDLSSQDNVMPTNHDNPMHINFQLKTAAVFNSRFAEPLLLDSDNIPVLDPETLYESETYREYGSIFWPDIARTRPQNPAWAITNTKCRMDEYEQESGQLLVDKRRFFYHLQLAAWLHNTQTSYYAAFILGDKDMFRFSWHALKTKYGYPPKWITSVGTLSRAENEDESAPGVYCGHSFAQHHPNGSVAFLHGGLLKVMAKEVMIWHREKNGGVFQVYKRSKDDEHHAVSVHCGIKWDGADYLPSRYRPGGDGKVNVAMCTDYYDIEARPLEEIIPGGFEKIFAEIGGYWRIDGTKDEMSPFEAYQLEKDKNKDGGKKEERSL